MPNEILTHTSGTYFCWADSSQYNNPTSSFARTNEIRLKGLAANKARQSDKVDLGAKRAGGYVVRGAVSFAVAPTAGGPVEYYWSSSPIATAASGNTGGYQVSPYIPYVSGVDGTFDPIFADAEADLDEYKGLLSFVGVLAAAGDANNVQTKVINSYFTPPERYGSFVVKNDTSQSFHASGSGVYIAMIPVMDEMQ